MTIGKASLLAAGFIGAVGLGIATGPSLTHRYPAATASGAAISQRTSTSATARRSPAPRARTASATKAVAIPASTLSLQTRLKPVLNRGTNMAMAAEGFKDAEQFATVAHAARNTEVPFVLLKHRVLNERRTLPDAIRASKPDLDAKMEARRAVTQARSDIAAISG